MVRAVELLDYTPGGSDFDAAGAAGDIGAADEIHGESGDDTVYGMEGDDILFGDGAGRRPDRRLGPRLDLRRHRHRRRARRRRPHLHQPQLRGNNTSGHRLMTAITPSRSTARDRRRAEQGDRHAGQPAARSSTDQTVNGQGRAQQDRQPHAVQPDGRDCGSARSAVRPEHADDIIYGGLGNDFLHGGAGDDAISGAEALPRVLSPRRINPDNLLPLRVRPCRAVRGYDEFDPHARIEVDDTTNALNLRLRPDRHRAIPAQLRPDRGVRRGQAHRPTVTASDRRVRDDGTTRSSATWATTGWSAAPATTTCAAAAATTCSTPTTTTTAQRRR